MQTEANILNLVEEQTSQAMQRTQTAVILQPGALGDCILTLPLAEFMKEALGLGRVDILGHTEYTGIFPGRTSIDRVGSIDALELHRLFVETKIFDLADRDPLINAFADYPWIVTFLGQPDSNFEKNLIFTANCSHSAEVITLSLKPPKDCCGHLTEFYIQQFIDQSGLSLHRRQFQSGHRLISATKTDVSRGKELLKEENVDTSKKLVIIQPGSGGLHKCWHADNFLAVAEKLLSTGSSEVVFLLGPAETDRFSIAQIKDISTTAKSLTDLPLTDVLGLLSCADYYLGNDSGITHLAAGLGVRTAAVFGPTAPAVYGPLGPDVTIVTDNTVAFAAEPSEQMQQKILDVLNS
jgi:heptosyltransferase-3